MASPVSQYQLEFVTYLLLDMLNRLCGCYA